MFLRLWVLHLCRKIWSHIPGYQKAEIFIQRVLMWHFVKMGLSLSDAALWPWYILSYPVLFCPDLVWPVLTCHGLTFLKLSWPDLLDLPDQSWSILTCPVLDRVKCLSICLSELKIKKSTILDFLGFFQIQMSKLWPWFWYYMGGILVEYRQYLVQIHGSWLISSWCITLIWFRHCIC